MGTMEWFTFFLAIATFWLAWTTRSMAAATKQLAELEAQPFVALKEIAILAGAPATQGGYISFLNVELRFANPGRVLVRYRMASVEITIEGQTIPQSSTFINRGGAIHPGTETTYFYPTIPLSIQAPSLLKGQVILDLRYWSVVGEEHSMKATIDLHIHHSPIFEYRWFYSSGPLFA